MRYLLRLTAVAFFFLGAYTFTFIPKDATPGETPNIVLVAHAVYYDEAGYNCTIYSLNPVQYATCQKK